MRGCRSSASSPRRRSSSGGSSCAGRAERASRARRAASSPAARRWRSRRVASGNAARVPRMPIVVRDLELDLDAFEGPFDLLLTFVFREELALRDVDLVDVVVAFVERAAERGELDLDACGEFLILISALLEL